MVQQCTKLLPINPYKSSEADSSPYSATCCPPQHSAEVHCLPSRLSRCRAQQHQAQNGGCAALNCPSSSSTSLASRDNTCGAVPSAPFGYPQRTVFQLLDSSRNPVLTQLRTALECDARYPAINANDVSLGVHTHPHFTLFHHLNVCLLAHCSTQLVG